MADKLSPKEFGQRVKAKYPGAYDDMDDEKLASTVLAKHPEYKDMVDDRGKLSKAWDWANKPLVGEDADESKAREFSTGLPTEFDIKHPIIGGALKGIAGAGADTMSTLRGLTSPASIALLGAGAIGRAPGAIGTVAKAGQAIAGAGYVGQGAVNVGKGVSDIAEHGLNPDNAAQTLQGGAQAVGGIAGAGEPAYGSSPKMAAAINNRVLGTTKRGFSFGRDPGLTVAKEGIVGNSSKGLQENIGTRISGLEDEKQTALAATPGKFNAEPLIREPIKKAMSEAQSSGDPTLYSSYRRIGDELTGRYKPDASGELVRVGDRQFNIAAPELNNLKKDVGSRTNWQQFGIAYKRPLNSLKTGMYRGIDETLDSAVPRYKDINDSQSNLIAGADDLNAKVARERRNSVFGLGDAYKAALGAGAGAALGHGGVTPIAAGIAGYAVPRIIGSPAVQTRLARTLANPSGIPQGISLVPASVSAGASRPLIAPPDKTDEANKKRKADNN